MYDSSVRAVGSNGSKTETTKTFFLFTFGSEHEVDRQFCELTKFIFCEFKTYFVENAFSISNYFFIGEANNAETSANEKLCSVSINLYLLFFRMVSSIHFYY